MYPSFIGDPALFPHRGHPQDSFYELVASQCGSTIAVSKELFLSSVQDECPSFKVLGQELFHVIAFEICP